MSSSPVLLPKNTWTLVSTASIKFQLPDQVSAWAIEATSLPTGTAIRNRIDPGEMYTFTKLDGDLYMYSKDTDSVVTISPIS